MESGRFVPASELEVLEEQKKLIELIDVEGVNYLGIHAINTVAFDSSLPRDREKAVMAVEDAIEKLDDDFLNSVPKRHSI